MFMILLETDGFFCASEFEPVFAIYIETGT